MSRKLRLMSGVILFGAKHRFWAAVASIIKTCKDTCNDFAVVEHVAKQRTDEFQLRLSVANLPEGMPKALAQGKSETMTAKSMQINSFHSVLLRVNGVHMAVTGSVPIVLKSIQSTHGKLVKKTFDEQSGSCEWIGQVAAHKTRVSVSDNHASNAVADLAIWQDDVERLLVRWLCRLHVGHKVSELQWNAFPGDLRGMSFAILALKGPAAMRLWRDGVMVWIREKLDMTEASDAGQEESASDVHRRKVYGIFAHGTETLFCGPEPKSGSSDCSACRLYSTAISWMLPEWSSDADLDGVRGELIVCTSSNTT